MSDRKRIIIIYHKNYKVDRVIRQWDRKMRFNVFCEHEQIYTQTLKLNLNFTDI